MATDDLRALGRTALALARPTPSFRVAVAALRPPAELVGSELASVEPFEAFDARRVLRRGDEIEDVSREPVAVTPTSQIHTASLDGAAVAVKVRRPGVASALQTDLRILDALSRPLGAA